MLNIALCCSAAMSTSLLVNKMIDEANKQGIQIHIWAKGVNEIEAETKDVDVILIAPQVKYAKKQIEKRVEELMNIVYGFFNPKTNYGYMDRGIVNVGGETYYEEVEQFDLFSGSAGIILAIAAIMNVGVMWEERIFVIK